jgi:hypothetical protein
MKRARAAALRYVSELVGMAAVIAVLVSLASGAQIHRWEAYFWVAMLGFWILIAAWRTHIIGNWMAITATWERVCKDRKEFIDELLDILDRIRQDR